VTLNIYHFTLPLHCCKAVGWVTGISRSNFGKTRYTKCVTTS